MKQSTPTPNWIAISAINLALACTFGALGNHNLKSHVTNEQLNCWHVGTQYFFYHALGLLIISMLIKNFGFSQVPAYLLQFGILLFVGSLYAMTLGAPKWFGAITPIGGLLIITAWLWLAWNAMRT